jgi:hypothetical protein
MGMPMSMAESSNTESAYENIMEKQSLEYGNGYIMTLCILCVAKKT